MNISFLKTRQTKFGAYATLYVLIVVAVLVMANWLANRHNKSVDTTANKRFSLSDQTHKIVTGLKQNVKIIYFDKTENFQRAKDLLIEVGLTDALTKKAGELSRGMHQKAQLVATIINEPDLLIVDEPFQGLDPVNATLLKKLLVEQRDRGAAVIMSTHDMEDAQMLCDRIVLIDKGRRLLYGRVDEIRRAFSDGAVEVVGKDLPADTTDLPSASHANAYDGAVRYLLIDGATAQGLFRELAGTPAVVERFAVEAPNLAEIFVRAVARDERAATVA